MSTLEFQIITDGLDVPIVMLLKEVCKHGKGLQILDGTWPSGQLVRALHQALYGYLFKCRHPLSKEHGLVTHSSNIPDRQFPVYILIDIPMHCPEGWDHMPALHVTVTVPIQHGLLQVIVSCVPEG